MVTPTTLGLPRLTVTVLTPEGAALARHDLAPQPSISIGRSVDCDLVLRDFGSKISRCHAMLMTEFDRWEFFNVGVNGSYENGHKIDSLCLSDGCLVRLSKHGPFLRFGFGALMSPLAFVEESEDITDWMQQLKRGDEDAAVKLWDRYAGRIAEVARRTLRNSTRVTDEEDVVIIAFKSLLAGLRDGRITQLDRREQLWRLLMVITTRKAAAVMSRDHCQKRGGGLVRGDSAVAKANRLDSHIHGRDDSGLLSRRGDSSNVHSFDRLEDLKTTPDVAAVVADETHELLRLLPDDVSRQLACLKMEGHTQEEIAEKLSCNVRTVERRLRQIRDIWSKRLDFDGE